MLHLSCSESPARRGAVRMAHSLSAHIDCRQVPLKRRFGTFSLTSRYVRLLFILQVNSDKMAVKFRDDFVSVFI